MKIQYKISPIGKMSPYNNLEKRNIKDKSVESRELKVKSLAIKDVAGENKGEE